MVSVARVRRSDASMYVMNANREQLDLLGDVLVRLRNYPRGARYRERFAKAGIDVPLTVRNVLRAIEVLANRGEVSVGLVASQLAIEPSSASRQVDLAVRHGLVIKTPSADDSRRLALKMTDRGCELARTWERRRREHLADALATWKRGDVDALVLLATRLADDIDALES